MKKLIAALFAVTLSLSMIACGSSAAIEAPAPSPIFRPMPGASTSDATVSTARGARPARPRRTSAARNGGQAAAHNSSLVRLQTDHTS